MNYQTLVKLSWFLAIITNGSAIAIVTALVIADKDSSYKTPALVFAFAWAAIVMTLTYKSWRAEK